MTFTKDRISRWEQELWHYVSTGDGDSCPILGECQARNGGGWSANNCDCQLSRCLSPSAANQGFIESIRPGRIFELIELLAQKYLGMSTVSNAPVPSSVIGLVDPKRTIEIRQVPLKAYHGAIWRLKDSWIIHLNSNDSPTRQRLTLFHEAFHILAHCSATPVFKKRGNEKGSFNELLAENFAYHLLMPRQWVEEKWPKAGDAYLMADLFEVPRAAMQLRLKSLKLV